MPLHVRKVLPTALEWGLFICFLGAVAANAQQVSHESPELTQKIADLTALVEKLQSRVDTLESKLQTSGRLEAESRSAPPQPAPAAAPPPVASVAGPVTAAQSPGSSSSPLANLLGDTTVSVGFDGYYAYNFNDPIGRVNRLRAYDVSSNAFSLNQANLIFENAPDMSREKRWGVRLDLQYGQATETLQGNSTNEPRPDVYRAIFQAYGTYIVPLGSGLTLDFGKWASSLGIEGNYTKDQMNYSRSYLFNYLPFYHMGARLNYKINDKVGVNYWLVNGTQQTEPYNGFKDELFGLNITPTKNISWTVNYYLGQEHPNVRYLPNDMSGVLPTFQGTPFLPIANPPTGKLHIFDSYISWQARPRLSLAGEADHVIEREESNSAPSLVWAGAGYARYQLSPKWAAAGRFEYLDDRGGLFSGTSQALKETTVTLEKKLAEGFLLRAEWRRDWSNQPYFYTDTLGILKKEQNTATLGVVWWAGGKQGAW